MVYKPKISFNIIVKNECANIDRALSSVKDLVDEMIVIDTGSTDNTKEIAKGHGAKVYDFAWQNHFADARNEALKHSTGDWILWIDGDEYFDEVNCEKLRKIFSSLKNENVVYMTDQVNTVAGSPGEEILFARPSIFRNLPSVRWRYRVHEQILGSLEESGARSVRTDIRLFHPGYHDPAVHKRKVERNILLLHMEDVERPNDPFIIFHLGLMYEAVQRHAEAIPYWPRVIQLFGPQHPLAGKAYFLWAKGLYSMGELQQAARIGEEGVRLFPDHPELLLFQAQIYANLGNIGAAEECIKRVINGGASESLNVSFSEGCYTFRPYSFLGDICAQTNRVQEAEQYYKKSLEYNPTFRASLEGLARLYQMQGRTTASKELLQRLDDLSG